MSIIFFIQIVGVLSTYLIVMLQFQFHFTKKELESNVTSRKPTLVTETVLVNLTTNMGCGLSECVDVLRLYNLTGCSQLNETTEDAPFSYF